MRTVATRRLMGVLVLLGGAAVASAMPNSPARSAPVLVADTNDFATTRDAYLTKAQDELQSWQQRIDQWTDQAKTKGSAAGNEAQRNLDKAWVDVKANWRKLQAAAPQAWDQARASFEDASKRMKSAWEKIEPQG